MNVTDIFVKRPVLASVVSLLILVLGLRAVFSLPVQQYPQSESAVVTITTVYYGADPDVVAGFITTPLEKVIAQANGIDYMTSTSRSSVSTITVQLRLNYDPNKALTEINTKINSPSGRLAQLLEKISDDAKLVEELYLSTLNRRPQADELQRARTFIQQADSRQAGMQDVLWSLLNLREFVFIH